MKLKAVSLFLGICLAIMAVAASPVYARSTTGFSAFHVEVQGTTTTNAYLCLGESYGQVINDCASQVNLEFNLPVDNQTNHTVTIQNDWSGSATQSTFYCIRIPAHRPNTIMGGKSISPGRSKLSLSRSTRRKTGAFS